MDDNGKVTTMRDIKFQDSFTYGCYSGDYDTLIDSFQVGTLLRIDDDNYQGDSRYLLRDGDRYGLLFFGWGSCPGCDALQACSTQDEVTELRDQLWNEVHWEASREELLRYLQTKDWELDFAGHQAETMDFLRRAEELLSE